MPLRNGGLEGRLCKFEMYARGRTQNTERRTQKTEDRRRKGRVGVPTIPSRGLPALGILRIVG
jgi:hypothetical protein